MDTKASRHELRRLILFADEFTEHLGNNEFIDWKRVRIFLSSQKDFNIKD